MLSDERTAEGTRYDRCYVIGTICPPSEPLDGHLRHNVVRAALQVERVSHSPGPDEEHPQGELHHLDEDPHEIENLWLDPGVASLREGMLLKMLDWLT